MLTGDIAHSINEDEEQPWDATDETSQAAVRKKGDNRKRKRRRRKLEELKARDSQHGSPSDGDGWVEVGQGEFAAITIPLDGGTPVVHRFETREEAEAQQARNIAEDQPLVGIDDHKN